MSEDLMPVFTHVTYLRVVTGPVRPVSTGFLPVYKDLFVEKYIRGSPQASM